jgi:hypothetical protein
MKNVLVSLLLLVSPSLVFSQNQVDIELINATNECQITLYPSIDESSILSNVVFSLKWKADQDILLSDPQSTDLISITKSGPVHSEDGWNYQIYSGCGFTFGNIRDIKLNIPKWGDGEIILADDNYIKQVDVNGEYYVSIGGKNATGQIINTKNTFGDEYYVTMFMEPITRQLYVKRNNNYYDITGKKVMIYNTTDLIVVRKLKL